MWQEQERLCSRCRVFLTRSHSPALHGWLLTSTAQTFAPPCPVCRAAAASDATQRYHWLAQAIGSPSSAAGECPLCPPEAQAAGQAAAAAASRPSSTGMNVAAASFLPHAFTAGHQAAVANFKAFHKLYSEQMALPLNAAASLDTRLSAVTEGAGVGCPNRLLACRHLRGGGAWDAQCEGVPHNKGTSGGSKIPHTSSPPPPTHSPPALPAATRCPGSAYPLAQAKLAGLQKAADAARSALAAYESQRQWGDHAALLNTADALQKACLEADAWLDSYERMQAGRASGTSTAAAAGSALSEHERAAAEVQAELQAHAAAAAAEDGGWTAVGHGGRAAGHAVAEADELEDVDVSGRPEALLPGCCGGMQDLVPCPAASRARSALTSRLWPLVPSHLLPRTSYLLPPYPPTLLPSYSWRTTTSTACWRSWRRRGTRRAAGGARAAAARRRRRAGGRALLPAQAARSAGAMLPTGCAWLK